MKVRLVKLDDRLVLVLPPQTVEGLGWRTGDDLTLAVEGGGLRLTRAETLHDCTLALADEIMIEYAETLRALAKS